MSRLIKIRCGATLSGIANVGDNPTFKAQRRRLEVFIDDFSGDIYGEEIFVAFVSKIRDEKIFANVDDLRAQLNDDLRFMRNVTAD